MPDYVGINRVRLKWLVINHIAKAKAANGRVPTQRMMREMEEELLSKEWNMDFHAKVELKKNSEGLQFHADPVAGRFDFVAESVDGLWKPDGFNDECRAVVQLRGFVCVATSQAITFADASDHQFFAVAVARNLVPHPASSILPSGDPVHPAWPLLHNLWTYARSVL